MVSLGLIELSMSVCFGGWAAYLTSEKNRIVGDIKEIKEKAVTALNKADTLAAYSSATFLTREEHREFDSRISKSMDRLSDRIDKVLDQMLADKQK